MKKMEVNPGDVFEFQLPNGKYAYGRIYKGIGAGFYKKLSNTPNTPPIGSRDFFFLIGFQSGVLEDGIYHIIGKDPFGENEDQWIPPTYSYNLGLEKYIIYHQGEIIKYTKNKSDCNGLEAGGAWNIDEIIKRIMKEIGEPISDDDKKNSVFNPEQIDEDLFDNDIANDVKKRFEKFIEIGLSVAQATNNILNFFKNELGDDEEKAIIYLSLVSLQMKHGSLQGTIKKRALKIIESGQGIERWEESGGEILDQKKNFLNELKDQIVSYNKQ